MPEVIAFVPVRSDLDRLAPCLRAVRALRGLDSLWLQDDGNEEEVEELLRQYGDCVFSTPTARRGPHSGPRNETAYSVSEETHAWTTGAVDHIAEIKNKAIGRFLGTTATHLLLLDSDICPPPNLLNVLQAARAPIVSEVFWTRWEPKFFIAPQVWEFSPYGFLSPEWIVRLRTPGLYSVGGLGACTLIERRVLEAGVNFSRVNGLPRSWGEDRSFCVRAAVAGFPLLASTRATPFHVYRPSLVPECLAWLAAGQPVNYFYERWLDNAWREEVYRAFGRGYKHQGEAA